MTDEKSDKPSNVANDRTVDVSSARHDDLTSTRSLLTVLASLKPIDDDFPPISDPIARP
jgi:hypothetical protein